MLIKKERRPWTSVRLSRVARRIDYPRISSRSQRGSLSEFGISIYIFILLIAFPLVDLLAVVGGFCVMTLSAHQAATAAATQRRFADCLVSVQDNSLSFLNLGLAKFIGMQPIGGYNACGTDLFIDESNLASGQSHRYPANQPVPPPMDASANVYECTASVKSKIGPLLNLSCVPFLGQVPGLGMPATLTASASRASEYPRGLEFPSSTLASASGAVTAFNPTPTAAPPPSGADDSGWNYPGIYTDIKSRGQTVVASAVLQVFANNDNWTDTHLSLAPGDRVWIDSHAEGVWGFNSQYNNFGADGVPGSASWPPTNLDVHDYQGKTIACGALFGMIGNSGQYFTVGKDLWNYVPPNTSGEFFLIQNDGPPGAGTLHADNTGVQTVRVIVTR